MLTKRIMKKSWIFLIALGFGTVVLNGCANKGNSQNQQNEQPVDVIVETVKSEWVTSYNNFPAHVVALNETELRAEVSGYLTEVWVTDGSQVQAGQKLYEIEPTRYQASVEQAKANLAIAEANKEKTKRDLNRYEILAQSEAIARQVLDNTRTDLQNAEAQVQSMKAQLITAETNLKRSVIRAPFSGLIGISEVKQGALVNAGGTLINTISSISPVGVDFQVNQQNLSQIIELQSNQNKVKDSLIRLEIVGGHLFELPGKIYAIDRAVNTQTGTITVRATFENPNNVLRTGLSGLIKIKSDNREPQLIIPYKAITEQLGQTTVFVVGEDQVIEQRIVTLGVKSGTQVVITSGLKENEKVVTEGILNIKHGSTVNPIAR